MANVNFVIPVNFTELVNYNPNHYTVKEVLLECDINKALQESRQSFRDVGPSYIVHHFDTYFSIIHHQKNLPSSVLFSSYEDLRRCILSLPNYLSHNLEDTENFEERKTETQTIVKMLIFLYVALGQVLEGSGDSEDSLLAIKTKRKKNVAPSAYKVNWVDFLTAIKILLQTEINKFWDPPGVDEIVAGRIAEVVYLVLEKPDIRHNEQAQNEMWMILGLLITEYNLGDGITCRIVRIVKEYEHVGVLLPDGVLQLVEAFHCKGFFTKLVHELAEWQVTEDSSESTASRYSSKLLVDLAARLPQLMLGEVAYLNRFLKSNSTQLRAMVLGVQVEVLLASFSQEPADDPEQNVMMLLRNDILLRLLRYTSDGASFVRARVFSFVSKLLPDNIIPNSLLKLFLQKAIDHLYDATSTVRKAASVCITTMLKYNAHGPSLSRLKFTKELNDRRQKLTNFKYEILGFDLAKQEEMEREWQDVHLPAIKQLIIDNEDDSEEEDEDNEEEGSNKENEEHQASSVNESKGADTNKQSPKKTLDEGIRDAINSKNYCLAIRLCREATKSSLAFKDLRKHNDAVSDLELMPIFMHLIYSNTPVTSNRQPTAEEMEELCNQERSVDSFNEVVKFLDQMSAVMGRMRTLLNSSVISDLHDAVDFIIVSSQFNLDEATDGIIAILQIMGRNEQDRRKVVLEAMRVVYLVTDSTNLIEHTTQVVDRLITLIKKVSHATVPALSTLISEWADQGTLGNDIIDALWQQVLMKLPTTADRSRAALILLRMATMGRFSIVEKNYRIVAHIGFGERGFSDLYFAEEALKFLLMLGLREGSVSGDYSEIRVPATETMWGELVVFIKHIITSKSPIVNNILSVAVRVIFKLHSKPLLFMEEIAKITMQYAIFKDKSKQPLTTDLVKFHVLLGEIAVNVLSYLDNDVYTELKRRQYDKPQKDNDNVAKNQSKLSASNSLARTRNHSHSNIDMNSTNQTTAPDDSMMDGADAVDDDAEYVSYVLEQSLTKDSCLGKLFNLGLRICKHPQHFGNATIQTTAMTAVLRGMLLCSRFCESHIRFIITILLRTKVIENKLTILLHISDLLERFPNVVEPYTIKLYSILEDPNLEVREMTLKMLSLLILKDMIRPQGDIWRLAACIVDDNEAISNMAKCFFVHSAHKSNNLYNYMPDIFSHLCARFPSNGVTIIPPTTNGHAVPPPKENSPASKVTDNESKLETILTYLFGLIDKTKQIEILVERFCLKYEHATEESFARRITFALTLLPYNDRAIQKLIDNFPKFKHFVLDDIIYAHFKSIITKHKVKGSKDLTNQLENQIKDMFALDGRAPKPVAKIVFKKPTAPKKKAARKGPKSKHVRRSADNSSFEIDEEEISFSNTRRSPRISKSKRN